MVFLFKNLTGLIFRENFIMMKVMENKKVLVVDDEQFIRELVHDFLEMEEIACEGAETYNEALDMIKANNYQLILLDRNLGKYRAEDFIDKIEKINKNVPIVLLTGDSECDIEYQKKIGVSGIIFKPFQVDTFMDEINKFLENK
jgi:DNA-binding NtrC family response regulator